MPEGDTLYRIAANLRKAVGGRVVTRFSSPLLHVATQDLRYPVAGRVIEAVEARGKNLLIVFRDVGCASEPSNTPANLRLELVESDLVLHTHLEMTGSWHIYRHGEAWQKPKHYAKVVIETEPLVAICFSAPTVELLTAREMARHTYLASLGPDAMTAEFDPAEALRRLRLRPELAIGVALMVQSAMAGVGNEFKSEILFNCHVNPFLPVRSLNDECLAKLIAESHKLLLLNEHSNRRRTRFELNRRERVWVYGRNGEPCAVCGTSIDVRRQGLEGRTTYYCRQCQSVESFS